MLTWYQWLIAIGLPLLSIVVGYGLLGSYCTRAAVEPDGLRLVTFFRRSAFLPWSRVRSAELFPPSTRLRVNVRPRFWAFSSAFVVQLAALPDSAAFLTQLGQHVLVRRVDNLGRLGESVVEKLHK
jgi:hypothetical protein